MFKAILSFLSSKIYIILGLLIVGLTAAVFGMHVGIKQLNKKIDGLNVKVGVLEQSNLQLKADLKVCSDNTVLLKEQEAELKKNAEEAITKAKKEAAANYDNARKILLAQPVGKTSCEQADNLLNSLIDARTKK